MSNSKAYQLGEEAFENGVSRVPALDREMLKLVVGLKVGEAEGPLQEWLDGWDAARNKDFLAEWKAWCD